MTQKVPFFLVKSYDLPQNWKILFWTSKNNYNSYGYHILTPDVLLLLLSFKLKIGARNYHFKKCWRKQNFSKNGVFDPNFRMNVTLLVFLYFLSMIVHFFIFLTKKTACQYLFSLFCYDLSKRRPDFGRKLGKIAKKCWRQQKIMQCLNVLRVVLETT